jgi:hypothetical protein
MSLRHPRSRSKKQKEENCVDKSGKNPFSGLNCGPAVMWYVIIGNLLNGIISPYARRFRRLEVKQGDQAAVVRIHVVAGGRADGYFFANSLRCRL